MSDNQTTAVAPRPSSPIEALRSQFTAMSQQFADALPSHIKPEKFRNVALTVVTMTPELLQADRRSLLSASLRCASAGLLPDGREAAFVIFNTKVKHDGKDVWIKKVQYMPMFFGLQKQIRNTGEVSSLQAHVVKEHDEFVWVQGLISEVIHKPKFPGDRGKSIGAYAIAKFKDGSDPQVEVMDFDQIEAVRKTSKSKDGPTWTQHWDEMARKTVFKRLAKWLPSDPSIDKAVRHDEDDEALTASQARVIDGVATARQTIEGDKLATLELLTASGPEEVLDGQSEAA